MAEIDASEKRQGLHLACFSHSDVESKRNSLARPPKMRLKCESQARESHLSEDCMERQRGASDEGAAEHGHKAFRPGLERVSRASPVARLGSAAVLEFPGLSGLRRRPDYRPVYPLDRHRPHAHGPG